jgi:hypothetical protein
VTIDGKVPARAVDDKVVELEKQVLLHPSMMAVAVHSVVRGVAVVLRIEVVAIRWNDTKDQQRDPWQLFRLSANIPTDKISV